MKVFSLFILLVAVFQSSTVAQNKKLDALYLQLAKSGDNRNTVNISNKISAELKSINADSALAIAQKSLVLAQDENYQYGIGTSYLSIGLANSAKGRYELLNDYVQKAIGIAEKINNDSLMAYCLVAMGSYNYDKGNYDIAIEKAIAAIRIFEKTVNPAGILKAKTVMAQVYQLKNDLPRAQQILQENLQLFPKIDDVKIKIGTLHTLANVYGMQEKYKEALALDSQGIALCEVEKTAFYKSSFYDNMANCYMYSNRFAEAKKYFLLCLQIDTSFDNKKQMSDTYLNLGNLMLMQKKYTEAENYLNHSVSLSDTTGYQQGKYSAYLILSNLYKATNKYEKAFETLQTANAVKAKIINETTEGKIAELETVYQTEKKEQQLKLQQSQLARKNFLLWGLGIVSALLIFTGFSFYRRRQIQNKMDLQAEVMKQQDLATKAIINAEENERKRIAAELHDGVGQMMSAAKMNLSAIENEMPFKDETQKNSFNKVIGMLDESCKEVRSVSHQMMPNALLKSGLASAVKEFLDKIDSRIIKINLHAEGLNERLDSNTETVLYRVIQECVNNVIKHAGANKLDISLIKDADGIAATVEDNGSGFDINDKQKFEGIGLKNINSRVNFLKGTVDFDSSPGKGTLVAIHVPFTNENI
jgi:two-component system, NarL family, sensor kinase